MSSYLRLDLEIRKSPCPTTSSPTSSSPSSTLSESSNSRLAICTRKPRTARKRPNQTYNEAAALLSTAYPTVFSTKHLIKKPQKFTKQPHESFFDQSSDLLLPFPAIDDNPGFLVHNPQQPTFRIDPKPTNCYDKSSEIDSGAPYEDDFDTESILDEEMAEGIIDSIMGISTVNSGETPLIGSAWYGNPMGLGLGGNFDFGFGIRRGIRPLRHPNDGNLRFSPTVDVLQISPRLNNSPVPAPAAVEKKKKRISATAEPHTPAGQPLLLKLNYEEVVKAWSDRGSPLPEDLASPQNDVSVRPSPPRKLKSKKMSSLIKN